MKFIDIWQMDKISLYFSILFSIIGFLISLIFSLLSGNSWMPIVYSVFLSTLVSFILGMSVYLILKNKVPEIIEIFQQNEGGQNYNDFSEEFGEEQLGDNFIQESDRIEESPSYENNEGMPVETVVNEASPFQDKKIKNFGDHIIVDKISIKNEPKLMAEAIRTMLSKDEL